MLLLFLGLFFVEMTFTLTFLKAKSCDQSKDGTETTSGWTLAGLGGEDQSSRSNLDDWGHGEEPAEEVHLVRTCPECLSEGVLDMSNWTEALGQTQRWYLLCGLEMSGCPPGMGGGDEAGLLLWLECVRGHKCNFQQFSAWFLCSSTCFLLHAEGETSVTSDSSASSSLRIPFTPQRPAGAPHTDVHVHTPLSAAACCVAWPWGCEGVWWRAGWGSLPRCWTRRVSVLHLLQSDGCVAATAALQLWLCEEFKEHSREPVQRLTCEMVMGPPSSEHVFQGSSEWRSWTSWTQMIDEKFGLTEKWDLDQTEPQSLL